MRGYNMEEFFKTWIERGQEAFVKGEPPVDFEIQSKIVQRIFHNGYLYMRFMNAVLEAMKATYAGEASDEDLNEIYNKMTQDYLDLYQENVGKYLAIPQFGIPRESIHQILTAIDSYHRFMGSIGDFLVKFNTPLKDSLEILDQAIKDREKADAGFKSAKDVYNFAVNILDKKYDDFLKSPEGVRGVVDVVEKYAKYKHELNAAIEIWFKSLSIPTKREMEDVFKGIYDLKKKVRKQEAAIREQDNTIQSLNRKIRELDSILSGTLRKGKKTSISTAGRKKEKGRQNVVS